MLIWATTTCEHGISCNEACEQCDWELEQESLAAQEDAERDSFNRGYLGR